MTLTVESEAFRSELRSLIREELASLVSGREKPTQTQTDFGFVWIQDAAPRYGVSVPYLRKLKQEHPELFAHAGRKVLLKTREFEKFISN